jgi:hypothetical protein
MRANPVVAIAVADRAAIALAGILAVLYKNSATHPSARACLRCCSA